MDLLASVARALSLVLVVLLASPPQARAQQTPKKADVALLRIDPLGIEPELVARLEALFRAEMERLTGGPLPSRRDVDKAASGDASMRGCTGDPVCLAAIGKKLGVAYMISGSVGALGDSYVIDLKLVEVASGKEIRRVEEPLSGSPDELIDAVRVAAYRLWAPERLKGAIDLLADVAGAEVFIDGKRVGKTPLAAPIANLSVGKHALRVTAPGYTDYIGDVEVRFQKSTQVVVQLVRAKDPGPLPPGGQLPPRDAPVPWYASTWGYVGIGAAAVLVGVIVGYAIADDEVVDCGVDPAGCGLQ